MPNLHIIVLSIFSGICISTFIWLILQTGESINNLEEDDDGFYDKRTRK